MKSIVTQTSRFLILSLLVPCVVNFIVHYGYSTNYTTNVFNENGFEAQYNSSVYRFRVAGRELLLLTHDWVRRHGFWHKAPANIEALDPNATDEFYAAYFVLNTLFLCLACGAFFVVVQGLLRPRSQALEDMAVLLACLLMALGEYVVTPYDTMTFFVLFVGMGLILKADSRKGLIALCVVIALGVFVRETVALLIAFYLAVHIDRYKGANLAGRESLALYALIAAFLIPYLGLRVAYGLLQGFFDNVYFSVNLANPGVWMSVTFFLGLTALMLLDRRNRREILAFNLLCVPYAIYMMIVGNPWELRLWTPILIMTMALKLWTPGELRQTSGGTQPAEGGSTNKTAQKAQGGSRS